MIMQFPVSWSAVLKKGVYCRSVLSAALDILFRYGHVEVVDGQTYVQAYIPVSSVVKRVDYSERHVRRCFSTYRAMGLFVEIERGAGTQATTYRICEEKLLELCDFSQDLEPELPLPYDPYANLPLPPGYNSVPDDMPLDEEEVDGSDFVPDVYCEECGAPANLSGKVFNPPCLTKTYNSEESLITKNVIKDSSSLSSVGGKFDKFRNTPAFHMQMTMAMYDRVLNALREDAQSGKSGTTTTPPIVPRRPPSALVPHACGD